MSRSGSLSPKLKAVLNSLRTARLLPRVAISLYSPTHSSALPRDFLPFSWFWKCCFNKSDFSLITGKVYTCYKPHFILGRFSEFPFCKVSGHIVCLFFFFNGLPSFYWFARVSCVFYMLILCWFSMLQISSPSLSLFVNCLLWPLINRKT